MKAIIYGKLYNTDTAEPITDNEFSDGTNRMNCGRCTTLYKTKKGKFFAHYETRWQGERDSIEPLEAEGAKKLFEELRGDPDRYEYFFAEKPEEA